MKYLIPLFLVSSIVCVSSDSEYEYSARRKSIRYAQFIEGMRLIEQEESLAERINIVALPIIITAEDHEDFEWHLLSKSDFEPPIKASTPR